MKKSATKREKKSSWFMHDVDMDEDENDDDDDDDSDGYERN